MRDYEDLPYVVVERHGAGITPFVWGAILGAGAALLLAPRSGAETQREIRDGVLRLRSAAEDRVNDARSAVDDRVQQVRDAVQSRVETVRDTVESRTTQVRDAVDAGRRAARDARFELERRVADAKGSYQAGVDAVRGDLEPDIEMDVVVIPVAEVFVTEVIVEEEPFGRDVL